MIPNQWYVVLSSSEVKPGHLLGVTRMGENLVFGRDYLGSPFCLRDRCAHRGAALSKGRLVEHMVECSFHGIRYDSSGRGRLVPANGMHAPVPQRFRVVSYRTFERHGFIWIFWGDSPPKESRVPYFFEDIDDSFSSSLIVDAWKTHYSRAIENQLDVMHLPFVHRTTIGRGGRTLVNGPVSEWKSPEHIVVRPANDVDSGQEPLRPEQIRPPYSPFHVELHFPNLWQNWISEAMRIVVAFVPVDGENTLLYLRFYQKFTRLPLVRSLVNSAFMRFNRVILHQDRRVVETQVPKASSLKASNVDAKENLVQGDGPIAAYRMRRDELIRAGRTGAAE